MRGFGAVLLVASYLIYLFGMLHTVLFSFFCLSCLSWDSAVMGFTTSFTSRCPRIVQRITVMF